MTIFGLKSPSPFLSLFLSTYICFFFSFYCLIVRCWVCCCFHLSTVFVDSHWHIYFNLLQIWWRLGCQCCKSESLYTLVNLFCHICRYYISIILFYTINLDVARLFVDRFTFFEFFSNLKFVILYGFWPFLAWNHLHHFFLSFYPHIFASFLVFIVL